MADQQRRIQGLGWVRDLPDPRDQMFSAPVSLLKALPTCADLRPQCPPVYDQGQIGSCTANAIAAAVQFDRRKENVQPDFVPSRLFIYYNERAMEGHVAFDSGAQIRDGIKSIAHLGVCPEAEWPYDATPPSSDGGAFPAGSRAGEKPTAQCYTDAKQHTAIAYHRVSQLLSQMKGCLSGGYPFVFGITVFQSFWGPDGKQAVITPLPGPNDQPVGGHALLAVGYDDAKGQLIVRNSWGSDNADHGYFYMPYEYVMDHQLASDFWVVSTIKA